jgi:RNA recognition motif-containing protein
MCKGYAFIEMVAITSAQSAVEALNGTMLYGKALTVKINEEPVVKVEATSSMNYIRTPDDQIAAAPVAEVRKKRPRRVV